MRVGRLILVIATLVAILGFPLMLRDAVDALKLPSAYAATNTADAGGRVYQNGNNNDNDGNNDPNNDDNDNRNGNNGSNSINNANDNNNDDDEDNDNAACYANLNSNEEVPCDDNGNTNGNDNYYAPAPYNPPAPSSPAPSAASDSRCFSTGETGQVVLNLSGGSVVLSVVGPGLPQSSRVGLESVPDMSGIPTPPGGATMLDALIWRVTATTGCDGGSANQISGAVNLGIPYSVSANKAKLQIVYLQGGQWIEVPTTPDPDPNKPYISSTIQNTGTYAVIQKP